ncbi:uncharacterized protein METZ01_LOCUS440930 [marine metagenome]|uniref:Uncharacterized protein n=1 Tax=marine metagenome TaxID=408172 RepID=A0A382YXR3_9ZZZZ
MIRLVFGFLLLLGSVGGMEMSSLSPMAAFILGIIALFFFGWPVMDGSIHRHIDKIQ